MLLIAFAAEFVWDHTVHGLVYSDVVAVVEYSLNAFSNLLMAIDSNQPELSGVQRVVKILSV